MTRQRRFRHRGPGDRPGRSAVPPGRTTPLLAAAVNGRRVAPPLRLEDEVWHSIARPPALVTRMSASLLLTTATMVVVQESPLLSVTEIAVPGSWSLSGSSATFSPSRTAPHSPLFRRWGFQPSMGGFFWVSVVA